MSVSCGRLKSTHFAANAEIESGVVTDHDIARMLDGGRAYAEREGRTLIHMNRLGFRLDGAEGMRDPKGLAGRQLSAHLHAVTADEAPLRNLLLLIERCYLGCDGLIATPYASALATTTEEERALGVTVIDFGAGTTSIGAVRRRPFRRRRGHSGRLAAHHIRHRQSVADATRGSRANQNALWHTGVCPV